MVGQRQGEPPNQSTLWLQTHDTFSVWYIQIDGRGRYRGVVDHADNPRAKHLVAAAAKERYAHPHLPHEVNRFGKGKRPPANYATPDPNGWYSNAELGDSSIVLTERPDVGPVIKFLDAKAP